MGGGQGPYLLGQLGTSTWESWGTVSNSDRSP